MFILILNLNKTNSFFYKNVIWNFTFFKYNDKTRSTSVANETEAKSVSKDASVSNDDVKPLFTNKTKAIIWGMQNKAVQGMLDFDHVCSRKEPSVVAMIYPFV